MTATEAPETVAVVHIVSTPMVQKREPFLANFHTPTCCVCGPLSSPMFVEDARDVKFRHERDVESAVAAEWDTDCEDET